MVISDVEKRQILLASKEELDRVDMQYGRINVVYREVLERVCYLAGQCQKFKLPDAIREVKPRPKKLKLLETIKDKILRKRAEAWAKNIGDKNYSFSSVTDIIGLKIICGYLSDRPLIEKWIYKTFDVVEKEEATHITGYRSWHYIVRLKADQNGMREGWKDVPCEIQVKTLLQEGWDEKTHDIVYRKQDVSEFERHDFALLSESLHVADKQSEMIRLQIEELTREQEERRQAALRAYFIDSEEIARVVRYETKEKISERERGKLISRMQKKAKENDKIKDLESSRKQKRQLLRLGVRIALETLDQKIKQWVLGYTNKLIVRHPDDPFICRVAATAYWALGDRYASLEGILRAIASAEKQNNVKEKNNCIRGLLHFIADYGREDLKDTGNRLLGELRDNDPGTFETKGFFLIKMARSESEIEEGRNCLQRSLKLAEDAGDDNLKQMAQAFYKLDDAIACRKLAAFRLAEKLRGTL